MAKEKFHKVKSADGGKVQKAGTDRKAHDGDQVLENTQESNTPETADVLPFPSVQSQLFNYLRKEQQEYASPVLYALKKKFQVKLCVALLDFIETGKANIPQNVLAGAAFLFLTRYGLPEEDNASDRRIIRPFVINH